MPVRVKYLINKNKRNLKPSNLIIFAIWKIVVEQKEAFRFL